MEVRSSCEISVVKDHSVSKDIGCLEDLGLSLTHSTDVGDQLVKELEVNFSKSLHIEDAQESSDVDDNSDREDGIIRGVLIKDETRKTDKKCLSKCDSFPYPDMMLPSDDGTSDEEEDEPLEDNRNHLLDMNPIVKCTITLPSSSNLVSAMKGSREKEGMPVMKLTVKWAPEVYDPAPTMLSHTVKSKKQQKQWSCKAEKGTKKGGKNKQKSNKVTRGSSAKDKKQFRKMAGTSDKGYRSLDARERLVDSDDASDDFDVGSPNSYCGGSFLRKSLNNMHMSVAEEAL